METISKESLDALVTRARTVEERARDEYKSTKDFRKRMEQMGKLYLKAAEGTISGKAWQRVLEVSKAKVDELNYRRENPVGWAADRLVNTVDGQLESKKEIPEGRLAAAHRAVSLVIEFNQGTRVEQAKTLKEEILKRHPEGFTNSMIDVQSPESKSLQFIETLAGLANKVADPKTDSLNLEDLMKAAKDLKGGN